VRQSGADLADPGAHAARRDGRPWGRHGRLVRHARQCRDSGQIADRPGLVGAEAARSRITSQGRWLASVIRGHCNYYGVPGNSDAINAFRDQATRHWYWALKRRSQRHRLNWDRMHRIAHQWLPPAHVTHPNPLERFDARTQGRSPVR
jgi:hypothetical protein